MVDGTWMPSFIQNFLFESGKWQSLAPQGIKIVIIG